MQLAKTPAGNRAVLAFALLAVLTSSPTLFAVERDRKNQLYHSLKHPKGSNESVIGIVEKLTGPSHIRRDGSNSRSSTSLGLRVLEDDILITEQSRLHVRFKDATYVELGEESSFEVERIRFKPVNLLDNKPTDEYDESVFRFLYGVARVTTPEVHGRQQFTVKTSNAIVKVTGPADFYLIQLTGDRDLTVRVARGKVELMNIVTNEKMLVPEGTGAYLKVSGVVTKAGDFTSDQLNFLKTRTRI